MEQFRVLSADDMKTVGLDHVYIERTRGLYIEIIDMVAFKQDFKEQTGDEPLLTKITTAAMSLIQEELNV